MTVKSAEFMVKYYNFMLDYEKDELEQLEKMYEADDLTEETEEIVLKRQRNSVEFAEFSLENAKLSRDETLKVRCRATTSASRNRWNGPRWRWPAQNGAVARLEPRPLRAGATQKGPHQVARSARQAARGPRADGNQIAGRRHRVLRPVRQRPLVGYAVADQQVQAEEQRHRPARS